MAVKPTLMPLDHNGEHVIGGPGALNAERVLTQPVYGTLKVFKALTIRVRVKLPAAWEVLRLAPARDG